MSFRPNPAFEEEMEVDPEFQAEVERAAAVRALRAIRLMAAGFRETGHFARSLRLGEREGHPAIVSTDFAAWMVEYGTVNNPPYAPFRRGLRAAGMDFEPGTARASEGVRPT